MTRALPSRNALRIGAQFEGRVERVRHSSHSTKIGDDRKGIGHRITIDRVAMTVDVRRDAQSACDTLWRRTARYRTRSARSYEPGWIEGTK